MSDWRYANLFEYLDPKGPHAKIHPFFRSRRFRLADTQETARVVNHWKSSGLIPEPACSHGWLNLSLTEMAWLQCLRTLRAYGVSLGKLGTARNMVMEWDKEHQCYPLFEYYLARAAASREETSLLLLSDGRAAVIAASEIATMKLLGQIDDSFLSVSLKGVLRALGVQSPKPFEPWVLSSAEEKLVTEIREGKNGEIHLKLKGGDITEIETTERTEKTSSRDLDLAFDQRAYGEIILKYENGKRQSASIKRRERL